MIIFGGEIIGYEKLKLIFILSILSILLLNTVYATDDMALNENNDPIRSNENNDLIGNNENYITLEDENLNEGNDDGFESIQKLIDNSNAGDSIYLENKTYKGNGTPINLNKNLTIYGYQDKNKINTILDADSKSRIFDIAEGTQLNLYGLCLVNGNGNGGSIYNKGTLNIYDSTFENIKGNDGGAIYNEGFLKINGSNFKSNSGRYGGVIYNSNDLEIYDSTFKKNTAFEGGAIFNTANVIISNSNFISQSVTHKAGVILSSGNLNINNSIFNLTTGSDEGGAIFTSGGIANINSSKFISNKALSYGGGIDNNGIMTIENSLFNKNSAYGAGAIDNGGDLTIIDSIFTGNKATVNGGAIDNNQNLKIIGSIFENNTAGGEGGAVIARNDAFISHCSIINNFDSKGYEIYSIANNVSLNNNWWGSNNPEFEKIININISNEFRWVIMNFTNLTPLKQNSKLQLMISFNQTTDKNNNFYDLEDCSKLAGLKGNIILYGEDKTNSYEVNIDKGNLLKSISIQLEKGISATVNDQTISLNITEKNNDDSAEDNSNTDSNSKSSNDINKNSNDFSKQAFFNLKDKQPSFNLNEFKIKNLTKSVQSQVINPKLDEDADVEIGGGEDGNNMNSYDLKNDMNSDDLKNDMNYLIPIALVALILLILIVFKRRNDEEDEN